MELKPKKILTVIVCAIMICVLFGAVFTVAKNASYHVLYEDLVKETIGDMVKKEALKGGRDGN